jgi:RNA polymerase sigma-70 factor, ECF subfamily
MSNYSPEKLIGGFKRMDPKVNREIFDIYYPNVARMIREEIGDSPDLSDLAFRVMAKLWNHSKPINTMAEMSSYINLTTHHVCLGYLKKQENERACAAIRTEAIAEHYKSLSEDQQALREARAELLDLVFREVENLSPKKKEVFLLHHKEELTVSAIALKLEMSEKTVRNTLSKAKKELKTRFEAKAAMMDMGIILTILKLLYEQF